VSAKSTLKGDIMIQINKLMGCFTPFASMAAVVVVWQRSWQQTWWL
jgi:hypothetical protein